MTIQEKQSKQLSVKDILQELPQLVRFLQKNDKWIIACDMETELRLADSALVVIAGTILEKHPPSFLSIDGKNTSHTIINNRE